ncbi:MAG: sodium/glutamate symporter [Gemmatimonadaceae bacterium]
MRIGGWQVVLFSMLASLPALMQNGIGTGLANLLGVDPLLGLLTGSVTMTGGHGTGAAFGATFEKDLGFQGAVTIAMAAATCGLVGGGLLGGPVGTRLIKRFGLSPQPGAFAMPTGLKLASLDSGLDAEPAGEPNTLQAAPHVDLIVARDVDGFAA